MSILGIVSGLITISPQLQAMSWLIQDAVLLVIYNALYVDHAYDFMFECHQHTMTVTASDTISISRKFLLECEAADVGVTLNACHSDKYFFREFRAHCIVMNQSLVFRGVGAYHQHQNGMLEYYIQMVSYMTRANMIYPLA